MEQFKVPEILAGVRRLRVGETVDFICKASRYFYSKGFQWAIETRNGQKKFIGKYLKSIICHWRKSLHNVCMFKI